LIEAPGIFWTIAAFLLVIGPLVFLHELGHYAVGRWFGVKAEAFSIGFGREIAGWTDKRGTRWKVGWLPLGGYVRFAGDMNPASQPDPEWLALPPEERARTFQAKPLWQRALIVFAGPVTNFLIAILILMGFAVAFGEMRTPAVADSVQAGSAAAAAGIRPGDRIAALGDREIETFNDLARFARLRPNETVALTVVRDGRAISSEIRIGTAVESDRFGNSYRVGRLGIGGGMPVATPVSLLAAPSVAVRQTVEIVDDMVSAIGQIITGRRSVKELGGPLKIAEISGQQAALGIAPFIFLVALISINLGFINLLPVPMLDGGHLLFYAIEGVTRRPVNPVAMEWAFRGGLVALLALMVFVTTNDLASFGVWNRIAGLIG
jgi:regulator of sigma E protease